MIIPLQPPPDRRAKKMPKIQQRYAWAVVFHSRKGRANFLLT
jgi:hypothetical protein